MYGFFILFMLVGTSNAVNLTDGLDGLAAGLSVIAFGVYGMIAWSSSWLVGYDSIAIFCFILVGGLLGFLAFNSYPAKIFMGDTGSLALGGTLAMIAMQFIVWEIAEGGRTSFDTVAPNAYNPSNSAYNVAVYPNGGSNNKVGSLYYYYKKIRFFM